MKKRIMKKMVAGVLSVVMGLSLIACGGDKNDASNGTTANLTDNGNSAIQEYVYVPTYASMKSGGENTWKNNQFFYGDKMYYTEMTYDEETQTSISKFCNVDVSNPTQPSEMDVPQMEAKEGYQSYVGNILMDKEGNLYVQHEISKMYVEGEEYDYSDNTTYLTKYDTNMNQIFSVDLKDMFKDENNSYIQRMVISGDGKIFAASNNIIYVIGADGSILKPITVQVDWIENMFATEDGRVFYTQYSNTGSGMEIVELNVDTGTAGTTFKNLPDYNLNIKAGTEGKLLMCGSSGLYEYDLATQQYITLLKWIDCNMMGDYVQDFSMVSEDKILVYYSDWNTNAEDLITMTKTDASKVPQKETIVLASLYEGDQNLERAVVEFNKKSDKYKVTIKPYITNSAEWTENTYSDALALMNNDMTGSNPPDMIDLSSVNLDNLANKDVLEDLIPYLEKSSAIGKEDYVSSVLEAYTYAGKLVTIPKNFQMMTLLGKSSIVGEKPGWTIADMIALADKYPEAALLQYVTNEEALRICLSYSNDSFIDYETGTCNFDSEEFIEVLEFASRFDSDFNYDEEMSYPKQIQSNKILLGTVNVSEMTELQMYHLMFEEPVTCIGYPTKDGTPGVILQGMDMYGILSKSAHKEGAWEFMESFLLTKNDNYSWGFPTNNEALEEKFVESMKKDYRLDENGEIMKDENGNPIENPKTTWGYDNWEAEIYAATQEEVDLVKEMINIARPMGMNDETVFEMIKEEAQAFFSGQKSAKDVATIIQSRVSIYVSENS